MYDPLALDRQRIDQDRIRDRAEAASRRPTEKAARRPDRSGLLAAVVALVPHPRSSREGCSEGRHALAPM